VTDRTRDTLLRTRRVLVAAGALFATLFLLLSLQLWLGRDPALGDGTARAPQQQQPRQDTHASVWDTVLGAATGALSDDDHGDSSSQSQPLQSRSS
jgi:hypothetical protein